MVYKLMFVFVVFSPIVAMIHRPLNQFKQLTNGGAVQHIFLIMFARFARLGRRISFVFSFKLFLWHDFEASGATIHDI